MTLASFSNGSGSVGADVLNGVVQSCDTLTILGNFVGVTGNQVAVRGGSSINDGGQGSFYWNATSTATADGLNIIQPTGVGTMGRWIRLYPAFGPGPYSNDTTAAAAGIIIGQSYRRSDGVVAWRVS